MINGALMQYFQWYTPADGTLWRDLADQAGGLADAGFTAIWFPPACKGAAGPRDVGYGSYDLFDLGEFDQKGTVRTKYGTRDEFLKAVRAVQGAGMTAYGDVVFNHKDGGDRPEQLMAQQVDWDDRNRALSEWHQITAYTRFDFAARAGRYSTMKWQGDHFDAVSYNAETQDASRLYRLKAKGFESEVSHEHGNFDYLLACDLDTLHPEVDGELRYWGRWFIDTTGMNGFRIDATKHICARFFRDWLNHLRVHFSQRNLFAVGEYWSSRVDELHDYIGRTGGTLSLFDVPLHFAFHNASRAGSSYDMRAVFDGTLVKEQPALAVTFVDNHDTQPCQSLESTVEPWFKPLAYALILLRRDGYPCVFHADYYGAVYDNCRSGPAVQLYSHRFLIDRFLFARRAYGFGDQRDYLDHPNTIGWIRLGDAQHPGAMAVVMSNGGDGFKWMDTRRPNADFFDHTGHIREPVQANKYGWANFRCRGGSVSVWLQA